MQRLVLAQVGDQSEETSGKVMATVPCMLGRRWAWAWVGHTVGCGRCWMWKVREGQESIRTVTPEWMETGFLRGQPGLQEAGIGVTRERSPRALSRDVVSFSE